MKNFFLTGERRVGKTTIIKRLITQLYLSPGGFMVEREGQERDWRAFYLVDAERAIYRESKEGKEYKENYCIAECREREWDPKPMVFEKKGVDLLQESLHERDIIIMDELGRFEEEALLFQEKVVEILAGERPVLGVLKDESNSFLDAIRERRDILLFWVTRENREEVYQDLKNRLLEIVL